MRLFLTINLHSIIKEELAYELPILKQNFKGKFVPEDNWHVTMLFLGEVEDRLLPQLEQVMETVAVNSNPFSLYLEGIGAFPTVKKPNILWAGVKGELAQLQQVYEELLVEMKKTEISFDAKNKYTPHLTLARKVETIVKEDSFKQNTLKSSEWEVNALECYQSVLMPTGAIYQKILHKKFGKVNE